MVAKYTSLINFYIKSSDEEIELIFAIEEFCEDENYGTYWESRFVDILSGLYDAEIFSEESIKNWAEEHKEGLDETPSAIYKQVQNIFSFYLNI